MCYHSRNGGQWRDGMDDFLSKADIAASEAAGRVIADDDGRLSYAQLVARADAAVAGWSGQDWVAPGAIVAIDPSNDIAGITALVALLRMRVSVALLPKGGTAAQAPFCTAVLDPATLAPVAGSGVARGPGGPGPGRVYVTTSGSTGQPKWVMFSHARLLANADAVRARMRIDRRDCVLVSTPLAHMFGLGGGFLAALLAGASLRVTRSGDPLSILGAERDSAPSVAFLIPGQCRALLPLRRSPRRYRVVVVGVGRLSQSFAQAFEAMHGPVAGMYGSTELGAVVGADPRTDPQRRRMYIGPALKSARVFVDADQTDGQGRDIGPVHVEHDAAYLGYADASGHLIAPAPSRQPTGDLGYLGPEGDLDIVGRADDRIRRDGYWVLTRDIETCLCDAEGVAEAAVVPVAQTRRGAGIVGCVVMQPGACFNAAALVGLCRKSLRAHMVPDLILQMETLPKLASGKIDLRALGARLQNQPSDGGQPQ